MKNKTICYLQEKYHKHKNTERLKGDNKGYHANTNLDKGKAVLEIKRTTSERYILNFLHHTIGCTLHCSLIYKRNRNI